MAHLVPTKIQKILISSNNHRPETNSSKEMTLISVSAQFQMHWGNIVDWNCWTHLSMKILLCSVNKLFDGKYWGLAL